MSRRRDGLSKIWLDYDARMARAGINVQGSDGTRLQELGSFGRLGISTRFQCWV